MKTVITILDNSSSSGITDIPIVISKHGVDSLTPILASLFNKFIKLGSIPNDQKCAIVFCPFQKRGSLKL